MKKNKYIREIASRLPDCKEERLTGFIRDVDEDGCPVIKPSVQPIPINHERRLRKAYKENGMQGIVNYLEWVHKLVDENKRRIDRAAV